MIEMERAAALGGLVAGVAHEINTPLGVGITALSVLETAALDLRKAFDDETLSREDLQSFLDTLAEGGEILGINLRRAEELVRNFKQVAVDQTREDLRRINLYDYVSELLSALSPRTKSTPHRILLQGDHGIEVDTYPGAIAQIVTNLLENSLIHAYPDGRAGTIRIALRREPDRVVLMYSDDGCGMPPDVLKRVFEPFFTARRGQGGSGLGMHIVHNLVVHRLGGGIECTSASEAGMVVEVGLPASRMPPTTADA